MRVLTSRFWVDLLGSEVCGNRGSVPCDWIQCNGITYPPVVHVTEDAFTLWLGTDSEWMCHMSRGDARKLAWWILVRWWVVGEWFGLRRWLYYKALHAECRRNNIGPT